jgi:hypothetical protein
VYLLFVRTHTWCTFRHSVKYEVILVRSLYSTREAVDAYLAMLKRSLSPTQGASSGCGCRRRPPDMEDSCEYIGINIMLSGSLSLQHGASSGCGWRRRPPDMEGSCKYID